MITRTEAASHDKPACAISTSAIQPHPACNNSIRQHQYANVLLVKQAESDKTSQIGTAELNDHEVGSSDLCAVLLCQLSMQLEKMYTENLFF